MYCFLDGFRSLLTQGCRRYRRAGCVLVSLLVLLLIAPTRGVHAQDDTANGGQAVSIGKDVAQPASNVSDNPALAQAEELLSTIRRSAESRGRDNELLGQIALHNIEYAEELVMVTARSEQLGRLLSRARSKLADLERDFSTTSQQLAIESLRPSMGPTLKESYLALLEADATENRIVEAVELTGKARLRSVVISRDLSNEGRRREAVRAQLDNHDFPDEQTKQAVLEEAKYLFADYHAVLTHLDRAYREASDALLALDEIWREQTRTRDAFKTLLQSNLLWMRSDAPLSVVEVARWPSDALALFNSLDWQQFIADLVSLGSLQYLILGIIVLLIAMLRRAAATAQAALARNSLTKVGWERYDYWMTLRSLTIHLLGALPLAVVFAGVGLMIGSVGHTAIGNALEKAAYSIALQMYLLRLFMLMLGEGGFARDHLRWRGAPASKLRGILKQSLVILVPAVFATLVLGHLIPFSPDSQAYRVASMVVALTASALLYRALINADGLFKSAFHQQGFEILDTIGHFLFRLLLVAQSLVFLIDFVGFRFTAEVLQVRVFYSLCLLIGAKICIDTAMLGIALFRRRGHRVADQSGDEADDGDPRFDLEQMNQSIVMLIHVVLLAIAAALGLAIWQPFFEALSVLDGVVLWSTVSEVDGESVSSLVSLFDVGGALLVLAAAVVLARGLPALIGVLLYNVVTQKGALYAIQTVVRYSIGGLGVLFALQVIGFGWSKLQWMAAGLSVGLGFGLQEIFANFFAGLIMLFERPVRIGDIVTLGEYSGTIQRIRMRATTILDFDNREVIVPNKMFVTERLINWTLSSGVVRLSFVVGLSYDADVRLAHKTLLEIMRQDDRILDDPEPFVVFYEFGDSTLNFRCYCHVQDTSLRLAVQHDLHMRITEEFRAHKLEIAYPQMDLHVRSVSEGVVFAGRPQG